METVCFKTGSAICGVYGPSVAVRGHCPPRNPPEISGRGILPPAPNPSYDKRSHAATHHRRV